MLIPLEEPAPLLEHLVHVAIERRERLIDRHLTAYRSLRMAGDFVCDALPFGDLRRRSHVVELGAKRPRALVSRRSVRRPRTLPRRQIPGQAVERELLRRFAQVFEPPPRGILAQRAAKHREARAASERNAGIVL